MQLLVKFPHSQRPWVQQTQLWIISTFLSQIRKVTASPLLLSKQTIPHYYSRVDACVDKLMSVWSKLNSLREASGGSRKSVNDLVIKAAALALRKVPQYNSSWANDYTRQYNNVNVNVAVQTDNGLFVPVIRVSNGLILVFEIQLQPIFQSQVTILTYYAYKKGLSLQFL